MRLEIGAYLCPGCHSLTETLIHGDFVVKICTKCDWYQMFLYGLKSDIDEDDFVLGLTEQESKLIHDHFKESSDPIIQALVRRIAFYVLDIYRC